MLVNTYSDRIDANYMINKSMRDPDFLNAIIENVGALVVVLNHEGRIHRFNSACEKLSGFTFNEVVGKFPWDVVLPAESAQTTRQEAFELVAQNPQISVSQYTNHWRTKSGELRLIEWTNTLLRDKEGYTEYMICMGIDITERTQMEESLRKSEERLRLAIEAGQFGAWRCDLRQQFGEGSAYTSAILGLDASQPMPMEAPPAAANPLGKAVMPPAKMQIIENEMAKFENPLIRRANSWAYPML